MRKVILGRQNFLTLKCRFPFPTVGSGYNRNSFYTMNRLNIVPNSSFRRFCAKTEPANPVVAEASESGMSMRTKLILFSLVCATAGTGGFAYMLATDQEFLVSTNEKFPKVVKFIGPYIGVNVRTSLTEDGVEESELELPEELKDLVGETLKVGCIMKSGKLFVVDAKPDDTLPDLSARVKDQLGETWNPNDYIVNYEVINEEDEATAAALESQLKVKIPQVPVEASREALLRILDECYYLRNDLFVQIELSKKYNTDSTRQVQALNELEYQIKDLQKRTKRGWW